MTHSAATMARVGFYAALVLFMTAFSAIVDTFFHPEIEVFDLGHGLVGLGTGVIITAVLVAERRAARQKGQQLEAFNAELAAKNRALAEENAQRRQAETTLRVSEERYRGLVEGMYEPVFVIGCDGDIRFVNAPAARTFNVEPPAVIGKTLEDLFSPERAAGYLADIRRVIDTCRVVAAEGVSVPGSTGRFFDVVLQPMRNNAGVLDAVLGVALDVTERRQTQQRVAELLDFNEKMIAGSSLGIMAYRADGVCVLANAAAAHIAGMPVDRLLAENFRALPAVANSGLLHVTEEVLRQGQSHREEVRYVTSLGREIYLDVSVSRFSSGGEPHLLLIMGDVTERRQAEAALGLAQRMESIGILAGGVAHDFNNLLTAMLGHVSLAQRKLAPEHPGFRHLEEVRRAAERAADLTRQLLAYSGKGALFVRTVDVTGLVTENAHLLAVSVPKHVTLETQVPAEPLLVDADPGQLEQVVMNLIINGAEAVGGRPGRVVVTLGSCVVDPDDPRVWTFGPTPLPAGRYVSIAVADDGCGMEAELVARIFDPFFSTKFQGRGLGLAAVLGIVRGHGGAIDVKSQPGEGTTITVLLPSHGAVDAAPDVAAAADVADVWLRAVLVVDDETVVRDVVLSMLDEARIPHFAAANGEEGLRLYREHRRSIGVVLLDLSMPVMDGEETFHRLREIDPEVKVILSSGYGEEVVAGRFAGRGLAGFIQKPYDQSTLVARLRASLA